MATAFKLMTWKAPALQDDWYKVSYREKKGGTRKREGVKEVPRWLQLSLVGSATLNSVSREPNKTQ